MFFVFFPKQVYLWGSILEKKYTGHAGGRAGLGCGADLALLGALGWVGCGVWPCWARWHALAGLGVVLGAGFGVGFGLLGALAGLGVVLGVLGALGGLGMVLGVGFGRAGRAGWVGRVGRAGWVGRGVGRAGRARWVGHGVGRGVWPCWARWLGWACWACWLGWAWCWAWGLAVLGALGWVGRGVWPCRARWLGWAWCSK